MVRGVVSVIFAAVIVAVAMVLVTAALEPIALFLAGDGPGAEGVRSTGEYTMQGLTMGVIWGVVRGLMIFFFGTIAAAVAYYIRRERILGRGR